MNELIAWAAEIAMIPADKVLPSLVDWSDIQKCHDWRNHVPDEIREMWPKLPLEAKLVAFGMASDAANNEQWD